MSDSTLPSDPRGGPVAEHDPLAGTFYRFIARLGEGGMGEVVEAEHLTLHSRVAVKLLRKEHFTRFELKERMRLEAQTCARIRHPNLVWVTDYGETDGGRTFVVMELLQGRSLWTEVHERGALPPAEAVDIACQALAGLGAVHEAGVVHRDVKPDNLFLENPKNGVRSVKVLDFGIAKIVDAGSDPRTPVPILQPTAEGMTVGTPRYASPEQSRGERDIDARADLYSMGWVLHFMLTGREPFPDRKNQHEIWQAHETELPPRPSAVAPHPVPAELDAIVMKAIAKRREERFRSAEAFRAALVGVAASAAAPRASASPSSLAAAGQALGGTAIIDPAASAALRTGAPMSGPVASAPSVVGVATVQLGPASGLVTAVGASTVDLHGGAATLASARAPVPVAPMAAVTMDPAKDAPSRPVHPWEREPPAAARRRRSPVVLFVVVAVVGLAFLAMLWRVGVW